MDQHLHDLHLKAGRVAGQEKTCGKKAAYASEEAATRAAAAHNRWDKRRHDVEPYPCAFCQQWHVGNIMPRSLLEEMAEQHDASRESEARPRP